MIAIIRVAPTGRRGACRHADLAVQPRPRNDLTLSIARRRQAADPPKTWDQSGGTVGVDPRRYLRARIVGFESHPSMHPGTR